MWQALLRLAVERSVDAVLDCGAQLAGTSNRWESAPGDRRLQAGMPACV